jgi:RHS repeat-associated protein
MQYDGFGRLVAEHRPGGDDRQVGYPASGYAYGAVIDQQLGGHSTVSLLDSLGRETERRDSYRQDGQVVVVDTGYDTAGHVARVTRPFFLGGDPATATSTTYDNLGRAVLVTYPDNSSATFTYFGELTTAVDASGHQRTVTTDLSGHPISSTQSFDGNITLGTSLEYGPFGTVEAVLENSTNVKNVGLLNTIYDHLGRPRIFLGTDAGPRKFVYDAFGERVQDIRGGSIINSTNPDQRQWDVSGGTDTVTTYDLDGRVTQVASTDVIQNVIWDAATNGIGKVAAAAIMYDIPLGSQTDPNSSGILYTYDSLSRVSSKQWQQPYLPPVTVGYYYDEFNRLSLVQYPGVNGQETLITQNVFSPGGQLVAVKWPVMSTTFWQLLSSDASDTFQTVKYGNGVVSTWTEDPSHPGWLATITSTERLTPVQALTYHWDGHQRLRGRDDAVNGTKETFDYYPGADLLQSWSWTNGTVNRSTTYSYDHLGNLVQRTDGNGTFAPTFKAHPVLGGPWLGPHQPDSDGQGNPYTYDDHGNQTAAAGRRAVFNQLDMLMEVINPDGTNYTFEYDGELHRTQRTDPWGGTTNTFGGLFDVYRRYDGTFGHVWHIFAGGRPVAQIETREVDWDVQSSQTTYLLLDHLASVDTLTDGGGVGYNPTKFAPFGTRVQPSDAAVPVWASPWDVRQGFAGHVDDDEIGLVDMVGRVYDPAQQRFLSQDRMAPDALLPTSFNPYAYVRNNPLNATDPTGLDEVAADSSPELPTFGPQTEEEASSIEQQLATALSLGQSNLVEDAALVATGVQYTDAAEALTPDDEFSSSRVKSTPSPTASRSPTVILVPQALVSAPGYAGTSFSVAYGLALSSTVSVSSDDHLWVSVGAGFGTPQASLGLNFSPSRPSSGWSTELNVSLGPVSVGVTGTTYSDPTRPVLLPGLGASPSFHNAGLFAVPASASLMVTYGWDMGPAAPQPINWVDKAFDDVARAQNVRFQIVDDQTFTSPRFTGASSFSYWVPDAPDLVVRPGTRLTIPGL